MCARAYGCMRACGFVGVCACTRMRVACMQRTCARLYCHMWPFWFHYIFRHYFINGTIFGKNAIERKMFILIFFLQHLSETFLILRKIQRGLVINVKTSLCKIPVMCVRF